MAGLPEDLIVFLLFAAFVLVQILRNWRRGRRRSTRAGPVAAGPVDGEAPAQAGTQPPLQPQLEAEPVAATALQPLWTPTLIEGPCARPPAAALPGPAPDGPPARRPSYRRLLRGRPALQEAIVVATILGPCRARRPHEME